MENPFPGMNPYLEQHWQDVHHRVVTYACDQIAPQLPSDLRARIAERVFVRSNEELEHEIYPDVRLVERPQVVEVRRTAAGGAVIAEPLIVRIPAEPVKQGYVQIVEAASGERVITVIEFLSLSNKVAGDGRDQYLQKQRECKQGRVSLVEIDLLRTGKRTLSIPEGRVPRRGRTPYRVCVTRGWDPATFVIYPVPMQERLPIIGIPLRQAEGEVALDLQALIDHSYRNAAYDDIDYRREPVPPLDGQDAQWAEALLREKGLR